MRLEGGVCRRCRMSKEKRRPRFRPLGASKEPLRVLAFLGGYPRRVKGVPGVDWWGFNLDIKQGGHTIEYRDEDPHIRKMFQEQLVKEVAAFNMPDDVYL